MMLKAVRQKFVDAGWVRDTCNKGVKRIRTIFKWGVENEMVSPATLQGLQAVPPLLAGRTEAKDNPDRLPATDEQIEAVKPHVSQLVKDLIDVQRFTGARAGELLLMTPEALDTTGKVWLFHVDGHKTEHHGHARVIAIGANAQVILKRRMKKLKPTDRIFKIRRDSYTLAVRRACAKLGIDPWTLHALRHAMGHQVRERFSLEHVQATLDHADFAMSEVYAKVSLQNAIEVPSNVQCPFDERHIGKDTWYTSPPASGDCNFRIPSATSPTAGVLAGSSDLSDCRLRVRTTRRSSLNSRSNPGSFLFPKFT
jgi:integrase